MISRDPFQTQPFCDYVDLKKKPLKFSHFQGEFLILKYLSTFRPQILTKTILLLTVLKKYESVCFHVLHEWVSQSLKVHVFCISEEDTNRVHSFTTQYKNQLTLQQQFNTKIMLLTL